MSVNRYPSPGQPAARRTCGNGPSCRGGASSVLRIGQPGASLLPMVRTLAQRMAARATGAR